MPIDSRLAGVTEPSTLHPVARVLWRRRAEGSRPGGRTDGHRVGLAVEGGGVRGVVSGGMLAALEELGLRDCFDAVYGSSAGALNAAYYLTSQASTAISLYYDDLVAREFVDPWRLLRRQPMVALDWVLDVVMETVLPVDWTAVIGSPVPLRVIASSLAELRPVILSDFQSPAELKTALTAGARIPLLAGPPVEFRGQRLLDAAVLQAHPYESAIAGGCTHVLSLSTRPRGRFRRPPGVLQWVMSRRLERLQRGLGDAHLRRLKQYGVAQRTLVSWAAGTDGPPFVLDAAPAEGTYEVHQLERDRLKILSGARAGYEAAVLALTGRTVRAVFRLTGLENAASN
jgi:predicted patatin/cPLA2 family phospholipase